LDLAAGTQAAGLCAQRVCNPLFAAFVKKRFNGA
jgi:hypothetical protein